MSLKVHKKENKMKINTELISSLNLDRNRYADWLDNYSGWEGDLAEFLDLDKIFHEDKIWVSMQVLSKKQVLQCAHDFAFHVLHIFEERYPEDKSIRDLLGALQRYIDHDIEISDEVRNEARVSESKAWDDSGAHASASALAAAHASASALAAANVAARANAAANVAARANAATNVAAYDDANAAANAAANANEQANQIKIIKNVYQKRN